MTTTPLKKSETFTGPGGIRVVLEATEIIPDDPGAGTPALVYLKRDSASYWCANDTGDVDDRPLSAAQKTWLASLEDTVTEWLEVRTNMIRRDGRDAAIRAMV